ncbi:MAG: hypothetical protein WAX69_10065 [Victivallales bacterium]
MELPGNKASREDLSKKILTEQWMNSKYKMDYSSCHGYRSNFQQVMPDPVPKTVQGNEKKYYKFMLSQTERTYDLILETIARY